MKLIEKVDYEKQLEATIEQLQEKIKDLNKNIEELVSIFKVKNCLFSFTGKLHTPREKWAKLIKNLGGKTTKNPTSFCTYCITNDIYENLKITKKASKFYNLIMLTEKQLEYLINNV